MLHVGGVSPDSGITQALLERTISSRSHGRRHTERDMLVSVHTAPGASCRPDSDDWAACFMEDPEKVQGP